MSWSTRELVYEESNERWTALQNMQGPQWDAARKAVSNYNSSGNAAKAAFPEPRWDEAHRAAFPYLYDNIDKQGEQP